MVFGGGFGCETGAVRVVEPLIPWWGRGHAAVNARARACPWGGAAAVVVLA